MDFKIHKITQRNTDDTESKRFSKREWTNTSHAFTLHRCKFCCCQYILKGKYKGDVKSLEVKLNNFIKNYNPKTSNDDRFKIVATSNMKLSHFIINEVIVSQKMMAIIGNAGTGKTTMIKEFIKDRPDAIVIEAVPGMRTKKVLSELCIAVGVQPDSNITTMIRAIARKLTQRDAVLIIDEAENLITSTLEAIRRIWDFSSVPTVLVGTYALLSNLKGRNGELLQLNSRITRKVEFSEMTEQEWEELFGDIYKEITKITTNLRVASNLYETAKRFADLNDETINAGHIKAVLPTVMIDN